MWKSQGSSYDLPKPVLPTISKFQGVLPIISKIQESSPHDLQIPGIFPHNLPVPGSSSPSPQGRGTGAVPVTPVAPHGCWSSYWNPVNHQGWTGLLPVLPVLPVSSCALCRRSEHPHQLRTGSYRCLSPLISID